MEETTSIYSWVVLHVNEFKTEFSDFMPTEDHLGVVNGSVACMDGFFHVEMTKETS